MTAPSSYSEQEGGERLRSSPQVSAAKDGRMRSAQSAKAVDYIGQTGSDSNEIEALTEARFQIISKPTSLRTLAFWGIVIFVAGFWHGRQLSELDRAAGEPFNPSANPANALTTSSVSATPAPVPANQPATITIRMVKFSPETIAIKVGDVVEWSNKDLTPHTATSPPAPGPPELDSGPINAGASWQHRFTKPGTFAYFCTFHPEMKGTVVVK